MKRLPFESNLLKARGNVKLRFFCYRDRIYKQSSFIVEI
jgi:hypothetical protein